MVEGRSLTTRITEDNTAAVTTVLHTVLQPLAGKLLLQKMSKKVTGVEEEEWRKDKVWSTLFKVHCSSRAYVPEPLVDRLTLSRELLVVGRQETERPRQQSQHLSTPEADFKERFFFYSCLLLSLCMWPCDEPETCPGCHTAFAKNQLELASVDPCDPTLCNKRAQKIK